jgi:hypothetical protein
MSDLQVISQASLSAPGASLSSVLLDPEWAVLQVKIRITGYSSSGTALIQFNNDTGSTLYAYSVSDNFAAAATGITGAATGLQVCQTANIPITNLVMLVSNIPGVEHGCTWNGTGGVIDASAAPKIIHGSGMWNNSASISSVQLSGNGVNLNAGSLLTVLGIRP